MLRSSCVLSLIFGLLTVGAAPAQTAGKKLPHVTVSGKFEIDKGKRTGRLTISAKIDAGWHIFSITQPKGAQTPTKLVVKESPDFKLTGPFQADRKPHVVQTKDFPVPSEEHHEAVTWTAPIELADGVDPKTLKIETMFSGQTCDVDSACIPLPRTPIIAGYLETAAQFRAPNSHATLTATVEPQSVKPGGRFRLTIHAEVDPDYHIYAHAARDPSKISKPTLIVLSLPDGWKHSPVKAATEPIREETGLEAEPVQLYYEQSAQWSVDIEVPSTATAGSHPLSGIIGYQTCSKIGCDRATAATFTAKLNVGAEASGPVNVEFTAADYSEAKRQAEAPAERVASTPDATPQRSAIAWIALAFLGGMLLNVMPCVLPVIGLKVMSFLHQAGESRTRVLLLNLTYCLGLMVVFLALATMVFVLKRSWSEHLTSPGFNVALACFVFVFGLSLLGVWEIPLPGFMGSTRAVEMMEREGFMGAFAKGVLTTILATPCTGPFMGSAVAWAVQQPAWLNYAVFTSMGLGLATPYLVLGAVPGLVKLLPRPGAWMETFKQVTGFILMGTVVFIFSFLDPKYTIYALSLLTAIGFACWLIGRVSVVALPTEKVRAWLLGCGTVAIVGLTPLVLAKVRVELPWEPYSRAALAQYRSQGRTVFVDFTANWCLTCKANESVALNRLQTKRFVEANRIVTLKADNTHGDDEIDELLVELGNKGKALPFYAIYPADGRPPIVLDGVLTPARILEALKEAGPSKASSSQALVSTK